MCVSTSRVLALCCALWLTPVQAQEYGAGEIELTEGRKGAAEITVGTDVQGTCTFHVAAAGDRIPAHATFRNRTEGKRYYICVFAFFDAEGRLVGSAEFAQPNDGQIFPGLAPGDSFDWINKIDIPVEYAPRIRSYQWTLYTSDSPLQKE